VIIHPTLLAFLTVESNMGTSWGQALFGPGAACARLNCAPIELTNLKAYWVAVAKFVRFAVNQDVDPIDYDSDDEIDLRFSRSDRIGMDEQD
jgi:hypothetical protein